jgi:hypothetical protein
VSSHSYKVNSYALKEHLFVGAGIDVTLHEGNDFAIE